MLWPLFHYLLDRVPLDANDWARMYARQSPVRRRGRERVPAGRPGVGPRLSADARARDAARTRAGARIGFFLHIPFPSFEVFRILPWRQRAPRRPARRRPRRLPHAGRTRATASTSLRHSSTSNPTASTRLRRTHGAARGVSDGHRRAAASKQTAELPISAAGHDRGPRTSRRPPPAARRRSPRLHQGHPAPPARASSACCKKHPEPGATRCRFVQVAVPSRDERRRLPGLPPAR